MKKRREEQGKRPKYDMLEAEQKKIQWKDLQNPQGEYIPRPIQSRL